MEHLHLPLLHPATTPAAAADAAAATTDSTTARAVLIRLVLVVIVAVISSWASMEASKGFDVVILNQVGTTAAGRRFHLLFQSDDEAERIVLHASASVERLLFPNQLHPRRPNRRVTLRLTSSNYTSYLITRHFSDEVTLEVSSAIMEEDDVRASMKAVVLRGMARAWLWDGQGQAPEQLVDGMADCVTVMAGTRSIKSGYYSEYSLSSAEAAEVVEDDCWEGEEEGRVAGFFLYCEELRPGFLARLNGGMEHRWHGRREVDLALGSPAREACVAYRRRLVMAGGGHGEAH